MSTTDRQNKLIIAEDWKKIYQSFKYADFKSYDFDNLRRTMITYLRENYPEDFNDYIESDEYLALIDLIAFMGQNLAFRYDLNARDNFLELSERRESVLRLARLVSYNAKRAQSARGLLKFTAVQTTETLLDSNGRNISNQSIVWNDSANPNWYEQFIVILNAALPATAQYGTPIDVATIGGIATEQYRFNATNSGLPVYGFSKSVDGRNMNFEIVSSSFKNASSIYEEAPLSGNSLAFLYRDDGKGAVSSNTGFFAYFKQGTLQSGAFSLSNPTANESVNIDTTNINNDDVWLYTLDAYGIENKLWAKVDAVSGNNIIYNSTAKNIRKIYSVLTRTGDRVSLMFADGVFGDLPQGSFKTYYRTCNNLSYAINPSDIKSVTINVPYVGKSGGNETLSVTLGLKYVVNNATVSEDSASIKTNAPATYYTQGRMISGEDYNVLPLSINQEILKVKSINRVSSGISRYFDLMDTTGKYSHTNLFGTDGVLYKAYNEKTFNFSYMTRTDVDNVIINKIEPIISDRQVIDFYYDNFEQINLSTVSPLTFYQKTSDTNRATGYIGFVDDTTPKKLGAYASADMQLFVIGSMLKFEPPVGYLFDKNNNLVLSTNPSGIKSYIWTKIIVINGDGTASGTGVLDSGLGPVILNDIIPNGAIITAIIPKYTTAIESSVKTAMNDLIFGKKEFGLRYDINTFTWKIITQNNLDKNSSFSVAKSGDQSNQYHDSSWFIMLETTGGVYTVTYRTAQYVFESAQEIRFFYDATDKVYDSNTGKIIRDKISVLSINTVPDNTIPFTKDYDWAIIDEYKGADGYIDTKKIAISFYDSDNDGILDDPDIFKQIVNPTYNITSKYIFEHRSVTPDGTIDYHYVENTNGLILVYESAYLIDASNLSDGQLVYIIDENVVKTYNKTLSVFVTNPDYKGYLGRDNIKFHYVHASSETSRIDPSATNIMDVYMLTRTYDQQYRAWIAGMISEQPLPPSSDALYINFGSSLDNIKSISDEVIYHPVKYKNIFGASADYLLQATIKVTKNQNIIISDNDVKSGVINAINEFFAVDNWEFGDTFYFAELSTYIMQRMAPNISNVVLVPVAANLAFGSLYEIKSNADELFISSATVDDIQIITEITAAGLNTTGTVLTSTASNTNTIQSA